MLEAMLCIASTERKGKKTGELTEGGRSKDTKNGTQASHHPPPLYVLTAKFWHSAPTSSGLSLVCAPGHPVSSPPLQLDVLSFQLSPTISEC